jgi:hypothetical protein
MSGRFCSRKARLSHSQKKSFWAWWVSEPDSAFSPACLNRLARFNRLAVQRSTEKPTAMQKKEKRADENSRNRFDNRG